MTCRRSTCATSSSAAPCRGPPPPARTRTTPSARKGAVLAGHQLRELHRPAAAAALPARFVEHLALALTGQASPVLGGRCAGRAFGDNIARGYITVDTVNNCTLRFPGDPGYFGRRTATPPTRTCSGGTTSTSTRLQNFADGNTLVRIEASPTDPQTSVAGQYTFYGRYVGWTAADNREPLATNFAVALRQRRHVQRRHGPDRLARLQGQPGPFTCPARTGAPGLVPAGPGGRS